MMNKSKLIVYIWNLFRIFGGKFSYSSDEMHWVLTQRVKQFDKYFLHKVEKSDGSNVEIRKDIWSLSEDELISFANEVVKMAHEKYGGFYLPSQEDYLNDIDSFNDYADKVKILTDIFL